MPLIIPQIFHASGNPIALGHPPSAFIGNIHMIFSRKSLLALRKKLFSRRMFHRRHRVVVARNRIRPRFEMLEERRVLATVTWVAPGSGSWDVAANWDIGVPTASDDVFIPNLAGTPTISINSGASAVAKSVTSAELVDIGSLSSLVISGTSTSTFGGGLNVT